MEPKVLYQNQDYRVVLRDLEKYPEGYVDIESEYTDALGIKYWHHTDGISLEYNKQTGHPAVKMFISLMKEKAGIK